MCCIHLKVGWNGLSFRSLRRLREVLADQLQLLSSVVHEERFFANFLEVLLEAIPVYLVKKQKGVHCALDVSPLSVTDSELWGYSATCPGN